MSLSVFEVLRQFDPSLESCRVMATRFGIDEIQQGRLIQMGYWNTLFFGVTHFRLVEDAWGFIGVQIKPNVPLEECPVIEVRSGSDGAITVSPQLKN
jgi:hypothetical protein